jgi:TonB family protein
VLVTAIEHAWGAGWRAPFLALFVSLGACFAADCRAPIYRRGYVWEDSPASIMMNISLAIEDFAPARLVCLAEVLKKRYSDRRKIDVFVFSDHTAARHYTHPSAGDYVKPLPNWAGQNHAIYVFDADKQKDFIYIEPLGTGTGYEPNVGTAINLRLGAIPPCTLVYDCRCLLVLDDIEYPGSQQKAGVSADIELQGMIARNGSVIDVRTASPVSRAHGPLAKSAIQNLKTWHFEPAQRQSTLRITYSYRLRTWRSPGSWLHLQFGLPDKVEITGTSPE